MSTEKLQQTIIAALEDMKAEDIKSLAVGHLTYMAEAMIFASGRSSAHVKSLANTVAVAVKETLGEPAKIEGADVGEWVIVDCNDVIVHVFQPETRAFYDIEQLWSVPAPKKAND